jgi:hypothetical protein
VFAQVIRRLRNLRAIGRSCASLMVARRLDREVRGAGEVADRHERCHPPLFALHADRDLAGPIALFTDGATLVDEGETWHRVADLTWYFSIVDDRIRRLAIAR